MLVTFSMSSRQRELSVNEMCEYLIPSSLYCGSGEEKEEEGEKEEGGSRRGIRRKRKMSAYCKEQVV